MDSTRRPPPPPAFDDSVRVMDVTTVLRSPEDLYHAWREITDLPRFIDSLESVVPITDRRSRWTAAGPGASEATWEADITEDVPARVIAWRSVDGSDIKTAGSVSFTPLDHDRGTRVDVVLEYVAPMGALGRAASKATGDDAKTQVRRALHRFRQVMETGEAAVRHGQPAGEGRDDRPDGDDHRETDSDLRDVAQATPRRAAQMEER
jgi:uncharacterized membrane protein